MFENLAGANETWQVNNAACTLLDDIPTGCLCMTMELKSQEVVFSCNLVI